MLLVLMFYLYVNDDTSSISIHQFQVIITFLKFNLICIHSIVVNVRSNMEL